MSPEKEHKEHPRAAKLAKSIGRIAGRFLGVAATVAIPYMAYKIGVEFADPDTTNNILLKGVDYATQGLCDATGVAGGLVTLLYTAAGLKSEQQIASPSNTPKVPKNS